MSSIKEIMQFCRLCLVKDQVNVAIFEEHGDTRDVKRKISACLPVTVSEEDRLPKKICDGCLYKLDLLYQFRTTCVSAEKQLQVWLDELNNSESISKDDEVLQLQHTQTSVKEEIIDSMDHQEKTEYVVEQQQISYEEGDIPYNESQDEIDDGDATNSSDDEPLAKRRKRILEEQQRLQIAETSKSTEGNNMAVTKLEHESDDENVDDPEPNFVSVSNDDQQPGPSGLNRMSTTTNNAEIPYSQDQKLQPITCISSTITPTTKVFLFHKYRRPIRNEFQPRTCTYCNRTYTTKGSFMTHKTKCPPDPLHFKVITPMSCIHCRRTYETKESFSKHFKRCLRGSVVPCDLCPKLFKSAHERNRHKRTIHENVQQYSCDICGQTFRYHLTYINHKNRHLNRRDYECEECGQKFVVKTTYQYHVLSKHKHVRYPCKVCGKTFVDERYLKRHSVKHNNNSEQECFACFECDKKYTNMVNLNRHIKLHGNAKCLNVCEIYGKTVSLNMTLRDHMKAGTEKPFKCEVCKKPFKSKDGLDLHIRTHIKVKAEPYVCQVCEKAFTQRSSLVVHVRQHTGEKPNLCIVCNKAFCTKSLLKIHSKKCHDVPLSDI